MLGLISTKTNQVEDGGRAEAAHRRGGAACGAPTEAGLPGRNAAFSCGFAGSPLTYDSQVQKIQRMVEVDARGVGRLTTRYTPKVKRLPRFEGTMRSGMRRRIASTKLAPVQCMGTTTSGFSASSASTVCAM